MKKIRAVNYLALDLEMNKDDQDNINKIIQVGVEQKTFPFEVCCL